MGSQQGGRPERGRPRRGHPESGRTERGRSKRVAPKRVAPEGVTPPKNSELVYFCNISGIDYGFSLLEIHLNRMGLRQTEMEVFTVSEQYFFRYIIGVFSFGISCPEMGRPKSVAPKRVAPKGSPRNGRLQRKTKVQELLHKCINPVIPCVARSPDRSVSLFDQTERSILSTNEIS